jgi:hypothetical protein
MSMFIEKSIKKIDFCILVFEINVQSNLVIVN